MPCQDIKLQKNLIIWLIFFCIFVEHFPFEGPGHLSLQPHSYFINAPILLKLVLFEAHKDILIVFLFEIFVIKCILNNIRLRVPKSTKKWLSGH